LAGVVVAVVAVIEFHDCLLAMEYLNVTDNSNFERNVDDVL